MTESTPELDQDRDQGWQRLDPRMLLVHPVRELVRFLPALLAVAVAGASGAGELWQLIGVAVPVALGLLRYLTTRFRIAGGRIELRRGLLNRHVLATPVDRVRTVDLTSSPIHRILGLTTVRIGTGSVSTDHDEQLALDGLPVARARELRHELLLVGGDTDPSPGAPTPGPGAISADADQVVVRFDPSWVRFAPFTGSGLVLAAATVGVASQVLNAVGAFDRLDPSSVADRADATPVPLLVAGLVLVVVAALSVLAAASYLVTNWDLRLTRGRGRDGLTWHLSRGLFTTRETTLDDDRVAGVTVVEPIGLRLVRGARLLAIVTGLDRRQRASAALVPPAPRADVARVAAAVLGTAEPLAHDLVRHGPRAVRRRWVRALAPALLLAAAAVTATAAGVGTWPLVVLLVVPVAALLAADRTRSLGHALRAGHLVARSGSLLRRRRMLDVDDVIGWTFRATWFQRRAGLTTLVATTAGGPQAVPVLDIPEPVAVDLAVRAIPDLVDQFRRTVPPTSSVA